MPMVSSSRIIEMRIFKILPRWEWDAARSKGRFDGSVVDLHDGYIHFSTAAQAGETARRYFTGQLDLVVLEIEGDDLGTDLKWESSRGGDLFPHLYATLATEVVRQVHKVLLDPSGVPRIGIAE